MTEQKLYPDTNVTFNAQVVDGEVDNNDPLVTLTKYVPKLMTESSEAALRHRCKVQGDLRNIYRDAINEYVTNYVAYLKTKNGNDEDDALKQVNEDMEQFLKTVLESDISKVANGILVEVACTETILRGLLHKRCHYVGFAVGETRERLPKRDPVMPHDKLKNNHIAVNRGGNVTVHADEQIDTGDYVVVDFDWKDFKTIWDLIKQKGDENEEKMTTKIRGRFLDGISPMKLKIKSFKHCAQLCLYKAKVLHNDPDDIIGKRKTIAQCILHGFVSEKDAVDRMRIPTMFKLFSRLTPSVIAQCKSGCTYKEKMIDIKLESHIGKRSFHSVLEDTIIGTENNSSRRTRFILFADRYFNDDEFAYEGTKKTETYFTYRLFHNKKPGGAVQKKGIILDNIKEMQSRVEDFEKKIQEKEEEYNRTANIKVKEQINFLRFDRDGVKSKLKKLNRELEELESEYAQEVTDQSLWTLVEGPNVQTEIKKLKATTHLTGAQRKRMMRLVIDYHALHGEHFDESLCPELSDDSEPASAPTRSTPSAAAPSAPTATTTASPSTEPSSVVAPSSAANASVTTPTTQAKPKKAKKSTPGPK